MKIGYLIEDDYLKHNHVYYTVIKTQTHPDTKDVLWVRLRQVGNFGCYSWTGRLYPNGILVSEDIFLTAEPTKLNDWVIHLPDQED